MDPRSRSMRLPEIGIPKGAPADGGRRRKVWQVISQLGTTGPTSVVALMPEGVGAYCSPYVREESTTSAPPQCSVPKGARGVCFLAISGSATGPRKGRFSYFREGAEGQWLKH